MHGSKRTEEEVRKFCRRLTELGVAAWSRQAEILELCCGRGDGLQAAPVDWVSPGLPEFDLSAALISQYGGPATLYVCDCRQLPFDDPLQGHRHCPGRLAPP